MDLLLLLLHQVVLATTPALGAVAAVGADLFHLVGGRPHRPDVVQGVDGVSAVTALAHDGVLPFVVWVQQEAPLPRWRRAELQECEAGYRQVGFATASPLMAMVAR